MDQRTNFMGENCLNKNIYEDLINQENTWYTQKIIIYKSCAIEIFIDRNRLISTEAQRF